MQRIQTAIGRIMQKILPRPRAESDPRLPEGTDPEPAAPAPRDAAGAEGAPESLPQERKKIFTEYYLANYWRDAESVSGPGSTLVYTEHIRKEIPKLLDRFRVATFLDAPCGDYNWFRAMDRPPGMRYIGGDIVDELIAKNQEQYGGPSTKFVVLDVVHDALPPADLWMCRDCLFHFSSEDIFRTLANLMRSRIAYFLTSVHPRCKENTEAHTGGARQINLELPPYSLCPPILCIDDWIPGFTVRSLALWTRSMVAESLAANPRMRKTLSRPPHRDEGRDIAGGGQKIPPPQRADL